MGTNELTRVDTLFDAAPFIEEGKFISTDNGVSAKSWYPLDSEGLQNNNWDCNEMLVALYSTGLCKLTFSVRSSTKIYMWTLRILNKLKEPLFTFSFSPLIIESSNSRDYRIFRVERRFSEIDEEFLKSANSIQIINAPA